MKRVRRRRIWPLGSQGFTVPELLVATVVAVILIGAAMPSLLGVIQRSRLDAATRQVVSDLRAVQSLAVTTGGTYGLHWGGDPLVTDYSNSHYRIEREVTSPCTWPQQDDTIGGSANVITIWKDLSAEFSGVSIESVGDSNSVTLGGVMFNSRGASVNACIAVTFPVTLTVADATGATRAIEIHRTGRIRVL